MKKLLSIALLLFFVACDNNDAEHQTTALGTVYIFVTNSNGDDLLDPDVEDNILKSDIHVSYKNDTYTNIYMQTRYAPPPPILFRHINFEIAGYCIAFGSFNTGQGDFHGETFTINWGDGTSDEIKFDLFVEREGKVFKKIWLNGTMQSDNSLEVTIVK